MISHTQRERGGEREQLKAGERLEVQSKMEKNGR